MVRELDLKKGDYEFTRNWFRNRNLPTFREFIYPVWKGKPITYLELGVFEGMSLTWMLQHVLTHTDSMAIGIDPWLITSKLNQEVMDAVKERAFHNTDEWRHTGKCILVRGCSAEILPRMRKRGYACIGKKSVDICMIDGNHHDYGWFR